MEKFKSLNIGPKPTKAKFVIPRLKQKKELLNKLEENDKTEHEEITKIIKDSFFNNESKFQSCGYALSEIYLVHNQQTEETFKEKRKELKEETNASSNVVCEKTLFFRIDSEEEMKEICANGFKCENTIDDEKNLLGTSECGIHFSKHLDIVQRYEYRKKKKSFYCIIIKAIMKDKIKLMIPHINNRDKDPDNKFDCHVSIDLPNLETDIRKQFNDSLVYIYDYDMDGVANEKPRNLLPYAVVKFQMEKSGAIDKNITKKQSNKKSIRNTQQPKFNNKNRKNLQIPLIPYRQIPYGQIHPSDLMYIEPNPNIPNQPILRNPPQQVRNVQPPIRNPNRQPPRYISNRPLANPPQQIQFNNGQRPTHLLDRLLPSNPPQQIHVMHGQRPMRYPYRQAPAPLMEQPSNQKHPNQSYISLQQSSRDPRQLNNQPRNSERISDNVPQRQQWSNFENNICTISSVSSNISSNATRSPPASATIPSASSITPSNLPSDAIEIDSDSPPTEEYFDAPDHFSDSSVETSQRPLSAACTFNPHFQVPPQPERSAIQSPYSDDDDSDDGRDLLDLFDEWYGDLYRQENLNENVPRWRRHYERTGRFDIVFRGAKRMEAKFKDCLTFFKFSDEDKTVVDLTDPTNKLILSYMEKKRPVLEPKRKKKAPVTNAQVKDFKKFAKEQLRLHKEKKEREEQEKLHANIKVKQEPI